MIIIIIFIIRKVTAQTALCALRYPPPLLFPGAAALQGSFQGSLREKAEDAIPVYREWRF